MQSKLEEEFGIPRSEQILKAGYPPKALDHFQHENAPIPLKHGDKVIYLYLDKKLSIELLNQIFSSSKIALTHDRRQMMNFIGKLKYTSMTL